MNRIVLPGSDWFSALLNNVHVVGSHSSNTVLPRVRGTVLSAVVSNT